MLGVKQFKKSAHPLGNSQPHINGYREVFPAWNARGMELNYGIIVELTVGNDKRLFSVNRQTDGWTDGRMDRRGADGRTDGRGADGRTEGRTDRRGADGRTEGRTDRRGADGRTDGRTKGGRKDGRMDGQMDGWTDGRMEG
jgi:hypothetical protein